MSGMSVRYKWSLLRAGEFRLDGGSMFGLVPRVVWSKSVPVDERGRIRVQHNVLLLEGGGKRYVQEVGTGDKLDAKSKDIFAVEERTVVDALRERGVSPGDVDGVVVSHLHFDHAGGLTRLARGGESADWVGRGSAEEHGVKLTFPRAEVVVQEREWKDALANRSVMTRTYFRDHLEPLAGEVMKGRLRLVDSGRPFPTGYVPDRGELPRVPLEARTTEVFPGVRVFLVPGHTWGQQATMFEDDRGRTVVFTPDVMPTAAHVGAAYSLGYDVEAYTSMVSRGWFLHEAAERGWVLVLDHEAGHPVKRVRRKGEWYELVDEAE